PLVRTAAVEIIADLGAQVYEAYSGAKALAVLEVHPEITHIFTDIRMPGMDGKELARLAKAMRPDLRIVLTSGYVGDVDAEGFTFLPKPWRPSELAMLLAA